MTAASVSEPRCVLGFDVGARRTGIAVGNSLTMSARALAVVEHADSVIDWTRFDALRQAWRPDALVVGEPLTLTGDDQPAAQRARHFARQLAERYRLPVALVDERSSSKEASRRFADARAAGTARRRDADLHDAIAAQIILERWLLAGMPLPTDPP